MSAEFASLVRYGQHLVSAVLNRTGFVGTDVSRVGGDDAFKRAQKRVDGELVGLGAAQKEVDPGVRRAADRADVRFGSV